MILDMDLNGKLAKVLRKVCRQLKNLPNDLCWLDRYERIWFLFEIRADASERCKCTFFEDEDSVTIHDSGDAVRNADDSARRKFPSDCLLN